MSHSPAGSGALRLRCQPNKVGQSFVFTYRIENTGPVALFVMDAMPMVEPGSPAVTANPHSAAVLLREDGNALLGKFIAPLPQDRILLAPDLPLCVRLEPGEGIDRELRVPLPFAESSPYFPDLTLRGYAPVEVSGVIFAIGYVAADLPGLYAAPAAYAPELHVLSLTIAPVMAGLAWQMLPVKKLEILKRLDDFPRTLKAHALEPA